MRKNNLNYLKVTFTK